MDKSFFPQILCLIPVFINSALINCATSWMANAVYFMSQPNHQPSATIAQCGLMASCFQLGRLLLAIPSGLLADKYGTKYMVMVIGCIHLATWSMLSIFRSVWVVFVARFFQGCSSALANSAGTNMIGELCSPKFRGLFVSLLKIFVTFGNIIEGVLAIVFDSYDVTVYSTTALTLLFFPTIPWIVESPYYLMGAFKYEETKSVLAKIRKGYSDEEIDAEYESLKRFFDKEKSSKNKLNWMQHLAQRSTRKPLISCILLNMLIVTNGTNVMSLYSTVIFPPTQYFSKNTYPLILSLIQLASSMITVFFIDALPRRQLYMISAFLSFMIQSVNGYVYYEYSNAGGDEEQRGILKWTFLGGVLVFWILSNAMMQPLTIVVKTEILPIGIRGLGNSICLIFQAIAAVVCIQLFTYIQTHYGTPMNFAIFAINSLLIIVVVYFCVPETRGKTLAEVQEDANCQKKTIDNCEGNINEKQKASDTFRV